MRMNIGIGCYQLIQAHEMRCNGDEKMNTKWKEKKKSEKQNKKKYNVEYKAKAYKYMRMSSCYHTCYKQYAYMI